MRARTARRGGWTVALGALVVAACQPITQSAPPAAPDESVVQQVHAQAQAVGFCGDLAAPVATPAAPVEYAAVVRRPGDTIGTVETFTVTSDTEVDAKVAALATEGEVVSVEAAHDVTALVSPGNDPLFAQQYGLTHADFPAAWLLGPGYDGTGVRIAIVDSGVLATHPDFGGRVIQGADLIGGTPGAGDSNWGRLDDNGHGTHVAGIAAASDNTIGGLGGAPNATIVPVRVLKASGSGATTDVAAGIEWAADPLGGNADVINLSLGIAECRSEAMEAAVAAATVDGVVVVASAGNCGAGGSGCVGLNSPVYPAAGPKDDVIAVGGTDQNDVRGSYSNYNRRAIEEWPPWLNLYVDVAAPGTSVTSTCIPSQSASGYCNKSGTSMSAPFVSAAAALMRQACGDLTTRQVEAALRSTAIPVESVGPGVGLIRAGAAIAAACPAP